MSVQNVHQLNLHPTLPKASYDLCHMTKLSNINTPHCVLMNFQCDHEEHAPECPKTQSPSLDVFVNIEDCYVPRRMVPEEASEGTGAENDNPDESKQNDRITAKDLKLSLSMGHEEHEALQKLRYKIFLVLGSSKESKTIMSFFGVLIYVWGKAEYSWPWGGNSLVWHFHGNRFHSYS